MCIYIYIYGQMEDIVVPKETWNFLKNNFRTYKHS